MLNNKNERDLRTIEFERDEALVLEASYRAKNNFVPDEFFFETIELQCYSPKRPKTNEFIKDLNGMITQIAKAKRIAPTLFSRCVKCQEVSEINDYCCGQKVD